MKNIIIGIVVIALLGLGVFYYWNKDSVNETPEVKVEQKEYPENIRLFGEEQNVKELIAETRFKIETHGYAEVCILGMELAKGFLPEPWTEGEEIYFKIYNDVCREYR